MGCLECGSEVRGVWLGMLQGKSVWQRVGSSAQKSTFPCPPPCLLSQPPAYLPCPPKSCNTSCPSGFHGNNCSVPCECPEGSCDPVSGACQLGQLEQKVQGEVAGGRVAFFFFLAVLRDMWDLSSLTRDRNPAPCSGSWES